MNKHNLLLIPVAVVAAYIGCDELSQSTDIVTSTTPDIFSGYSVNAAVTINGARSGGTVQFELYPGRIIDGVVNVMQEDPNGTKRLGGTFTEGTFAFAVDREGVTSGLVTFTAVGHVYELMPTQPGNVAIFHRRIIDQVICNNHPGDIELEAQGSIATDAITTGTVTSGSVSTIPKLSSKPAASTHLYLDFDGEMVQDPLWNGGKIIDAKSPNFTTAQIMEVWSIVSERFSCFNINITTNVDAYLNAAPGARMRVIFTPTNAWRPGFGGFAYINSFKNAGTGVFSPAIPCWVFTNMLSRIRSVGECAAHELAHTLGLSHDGVRGGTAYYAGHGGWAPIMGVTYNARVAQWSKGEYTNASNTQDDIAIIAANRGVGFTPTTNAPAVIINAGSFRIAGLITNEQDTKTYNIQATSTGSLTLNVAPTTWSSVDATVTLTTDKGVVVATGSQNMTQNSSITAPVERGLYKVVVTGTGDTAGYSAYGSVGKFMLTGSLQSK